MKHLLEKYLPVREAEGGGAGGGGAGGATEPAGGAGGAAAAAPAGGSNDAAAAAAAAAAGQPYRPQGLPDTMFGKDDRETMDKMASALDGYRKRDSAVPDKVEAYNAFEIDKAPEAIRPHLQELAKDPLFGAVAKVAMEEKVPPAVLHKLTSALYAQAAEAGILEAAIDPAKERAALLPESAKSVPKAEQDKAIEARLTENEDFIKLLMKPGADGKSKLDPKVGENALLMLMDTAHGNQFLEFVRGQMTGADKAQPFGGSGTTPAGQDARASLRAELAAPEMNPQHPKFDRAKWEELNAKYQRVVGV
ncbi:hypothetical protein EFV37_22135 [Mesorhizobium loti]|uniref:Uncharacterized protein n=1 Tax=Mesorhizobium jarvisii TaxID=1777867 RepID=A0A6M7TIC2_9HYPH|nr:MULTISPECIES: hypothetical protein [Mesorhizobium]OBQ59577.1 hypothetical protein A9K72_25535 [Mesorhizobium loti]QKC64684.1 hypothetical protein EB229_22130 [Mesorhizobium jarvisii]QKD10598.1 hypothetical protein EFV37_22135 [Mesorhizobium loti]RJT30588.1 hypothetical protein D3242_24765 [Mesorhizobium jarvisii]